MFQALLRNPKSATEAVILVVVLSVAFVSIMQVSVKALGGHRMRPEWAAIVFLVACASLLLAPAAARVWLFPKIELGAAERFVSVGIVLVCFLAFVAPLICLLSRANYAQSLVAAGLSALAAAALLMLMGAIFEAVRGGKTELQKIKIRKESTESVY